MVFYIGDKLVITGLSDAHLPRYNGLYVTVVCCTDPGNMYCGHHYKPCPLDDAAKKYYLKFTEHDVCPVSGRFNRTLCVSEKYLRHVL